MVRIGELVCLLFFALGGCVMPPAVLPATCGDGIVSESGGEECDDQGVSETCDIDCTMAMCGDGMVNAMAGEQCDTAGFSASCEDDCTVARCGDGRVNPAAGESCDDGNVVAGDGCNADCRTSGICGNGTLDTGEACDDGNITDGDGCSASCRLESCGNGTLEAGEACDHGGVSTATCDSDCTPVTCGDGVINLMAGEQCDDAGMSAMCDHDCTPAACGDSVVNTAADEECDTGGDSASCDPDCTVARCGDGVINAAAGETCDASGVSTPSCDQDCTAPECGDGFVNAAAGEQCDTAGESATCDADCTAAWCGDGVANATLDEERDPPPGPLISVPVDDETCRYDFSNIQQFYCSGSCGNWGDGNGCQQADADVFCKLKTGNPDATATSFTLGSTLEAPGICCPPPTAAPGTFGCVEVGVLTSRGVTLPVSVHDTNLRSTHAAGTAIVSVVCIEP